METEVEIITEDEREKIVLYNKVVADEQHKRTPTLKNRVSRKLQTLTKSRSGDAANTT